MNKSYKDALSDAISAVNPQAIATLHIWKLKRRSVLGPLDVVVKDFNYPMSIQLRQCSTNHAYATLWLKDSYIIVLVV